jgi:K+-sensing histidine kinase KdpD
MSAPEHTTYQLLLRLAHDARNPLAVVLTNLRFLLGEISDEDQREVLAESLLSAERTNRMIEDALDVERIRLGQLPLAQEAVSMAAIAKAVKIAIEPLVGQRSLEICLPQVVLKTDQAILVRALINLLEHGLRHSASASTVSWSGLLDQGLILQVADAGLPFDPRNTPSFLAEKMELRPEQSSPWRSDHGLGLHFAGKSLRLLGGELALLPREDNQKGVLFQVFFPMSLIEKE